MPLPPRHAPHARAFTLVEVVVVIIILGIVGAMVAPNIGGAVERARLDAAARQLAGLAAFGYRSATSTGRVHALVFDEEGRRFELVAELPPDEEMAEEEIDPEAPPRLEPVPMPRTIDRELPEEIALVDVSLFEEDLAHTEDGALRILFFPDGTTEFADLTLASRTGLRRTISINGLSGTVVISDPGPAEESDAVAP